MEVLEGASTTDNPLSPEEAQFVVDDSPILGQTALKAVSIINGSMLGKRRAVALAIREYGTAKRAKILRFIYAVPPCIAKSLDQWVAVPKANISVNNALFRSENNPNMLRCECERSLKLTCVPLTIGQRCADWFELRKFRVTGTSAGLILKSDPEFMLRIWRNISPLSERSLKE